MKSRVIPFYGDQLNMKHSIPKKWLRSVGGNSRMNWFLLFTLFCLLSHARGILKFKQIAVKNSHQDVASISSEIEWNPELFHRLSNERFHELHIRKSVLPKEISKHLIQALPRSIRLYQHDTSFSNLKMIRIYKNDIQCGFLQSLNLLEFEQLETFAMNSCNVHCYQLNKVCLGTEQAQKYNELYTFLANGRFHFKELYLDNNKWIKTFLKNEFTSYATSIKMIRISLMNCQLEDEDSNNLIEFLLIFEGLKQVRLTRNYFTDQNYLSEKYWTKTGKEIHFLIYETQFIDLAKAKSFKKEVRSEN